MKPSEAAALLGIIARWDNRTVGETNAIAWSQSVDPDITIQDATAAAAAHFAECGDVWIMPSHVNARVREVYRDRVRRAGTPPMPADLTYSQEQAWRRLWHAAVRAGELDAESSANAAMGIPQPALGTRPMTEHVALLAGRWSA